MTPSTTPVLLFGSLALLGASSALEATDPCSDLVFQARSSSMVIRSKSRSQLAVKYVYAKSNGAQEFSLCSVPPPFPAATTVSTATTTSSSSNSSLPSLDCSPLLKWSTVNGDEWRGEFTPVSHLHPELLLATSRPLSSLEFSHGLVTTVSSTNFTVTPKFLAVLHSASPLPLHLGVFKATFIRQGSRDPPPPHFTSVLQHAVELCPASSTPELRLLPASSCSLLHSSSSSPGEWRGTFLPLPSPLYSPHWSLHLVTDIPVTRIQMPLARVEGVLTTFTATGEHLAAMAGGKVDLGAFKVSYEGTRTPQFTSLQLNGNKLC